MARKTFISASKAAELAGVTTETIRNLCKAGTLQHQIRGILYYVSKADVLTYKKDIEAIHEATASITEYRAKVEQEARELRDKHEEMRIRLANMEMFPKRIEYIKELLYSVVDNYIDNPDNKEPLTSRDLDVIWGAIQGKSFSFIGETLHISEQCVSQTWRRALRKVVCTQNRISQLQDTISELQRVIGEKNEIIAEYHGKTKAEVDADTKMRMLLSTKLEDFDLSVRALNCLRCAELYTIGDLVKYYRADLLKFRNFGKKSLTELDELLDRYDLHFGMDISYYEQTK